MAECIYREICACINSRDGSKFKARVEPAHVIRHIPDSFQFDLNDVECDQGFIVGDQVKLFMLAETKAIGRIEPWTPLRRSNGVITRVNDECDVIKCDENEIVCFPQGQQLKVDDFIEFDIMEGEYMVDGIDYKLRAELQSANCLKKDTNAEEEESIPELMESHEYNLKNMKVEPMLEDFLESLCASDEEKDDISEVSSKRPQILFKDYPYVDQGDYRLTYMLPDDLYTMFKSKPKDVPRTKDERRQMAVKLHKLIPDMNTKENYAAYFHNLLYLEEIEIKHAFTHYNGEAVNFITNDMKKFHMKCEKIPELRPPICIGDFIHVWDVTPIPYFRGKVIKLTEDTITIKFGDDFVRNFDENNQYSIQFHYNRLIYKRKHIGVDDAVKKFEEDFIFPEQLVVAEPQLDVRENNEKELILNGDLLKFNMAALNDQQKEVIKQVLRGECRPLPYIIYGPPGETLVLLTLFHTIIFHSRHGNFIFCGL